jgi:hypothetical protein
MAFQPVLLANQIRRALGRVGGQPTADPGNREQ